MVAVLAEALEDGDSQVRRAAGKALDELKWTPADEREGMRHAAAMGRFEELAAQGPEGVGLLLEAVRDSEPQVRRRAASVLGDCNDPRAVRMLVQMTTDGNVAASAVEALGKFLKAGARETPEEALRSVAHLVNVAQFAGERNGANGNRLGRMLTQKRIIDCSDVKRLALQELGRRGVRV
jgi:HEAT repeat protein